MTYRIPVRNEVNLTAVAPRVEHRRLRTGVDPRSGREVRRYFYTGIDLNAEAERIRGLRKQRSPRLTR